MTLAKRFNNLSARWIAIGHLGSYLSIRFLAVIGFTISFGSVSQAAESAFSIDVSLSNEVVDIAGVEGVSSLTRVSVSNESDHDATTVPAWQLGDPFMPWYEPVESRTQSDSSILGLDGQVIGVPVKKSPFPFLPATAFEGQTRVHVENISRDLSGEKTDEGFAVYLLLGYPF